MVEPPTLKDVAASMLGVMWFEGRHAILRELDEAGGAVNPLGSFRKEVLSSKHRAHFIDHAVDARLAELDDALVTISDTVVRVHGTAQFRAIDRTPVGVAVVPERAVTEDYRPSL